MDEHSCENSLSGAHTKCKELSAYKSSEKPPKSAEKHAVFTLHNTIVRTLAESSHHRPEFSPPEALTPAALTKLWTTLEEAEKNREEYLNKELKRYSMMLFFGSHIMKTRETTNPKTSVLRQVCRTNLLG